MNSLPGTCQSWQTSSSTCLFWSVLVVIQMMMSSLYIGRVVFPTHMYCTSANNFADMQSFEEAMAWGALLGATLPARALKQGLICFHLRRAEQTLLVHCTISECLFVSRCISRAGCEAALRSDRRLCLQSYYLSAAQTVGKACM